MRLRKANCSECGKAFEYEYRMGALRLTCSDKCTKKRNAKKKREYRLIPVPPPAPRMGNCIMCRANIVQHGTGRPRFYCGVNCRQRAKMTRIVLVLDRIDTIEARLSILEGYKRG